MTVKEQVQPAKADIVPDPRKNKIEPATGMSVDMIKNGDAGQELIKHDIGVSSSVFNDGKKLADEKIERG